MLGKKKFQPKLIYNLTLDDLVPEDNLYRQLEKFLDLFIKNAKNYMVQQASHQLIQ